MKISVYITSFNQKQYLVEAINSVLGQTLKPDQIIIVDDCSQDGSQELIAGFQARYPDLITPIYHTQNTGVAQTRIDALNTVTADYVTYLDGDDRFLPPKLEKEVKLLQSTPNAQIVFSNYFYITEKGAPLGVWADSSKPPEGYVFCQTFARDFPRQNLFRNEVVNYGAWKRIGFYDPALQLYEDFEMRIRLTKHLRVIYYDEPLVEYRLHNAGLASLRSEYHFEAIDYLYKKNEPLLDNLSKAERDYVTQRVGTWIARIAGHAVVQSLQDRQYHKAAKFMVAVIRYSPSLLLTLPLKIQQRALKTLLKARPLTQVCII